MLPAMFGSLSGRDNIIKYRVSLKSLHGSLPKFREEHLWPVTTNVPGNACGKEKK